MPSTDGQQRSAPAMPGQEERLIQGLRRGDETAFAELIDAYSPSLLRVAIAYTGIRSVAEEVVQETWLGVLKGLDRFEGRSSLKTWIFRILTNTATTRGARERRTVPFSSLEAEGDAEPSVDPDRFRGPRGAFPGHWNGYPADWGALPEEKLLGRETLDVVKAAIERLPPAQRTVITLRDVEGWPAEEVCQALGVSDGNQRVLLHRARSKVRTALEGYFGAVDQALYSRNAGPRVATVLR
jgi:RNA polymerase sigma-70 factor, ECF subfamily